MALFTESEARALLTRVLGYGTADHLSVSLGGNAGGNIRYARNTVTTSGAERNQSLAVQATFGRRTGTATINEFDDASLEKVVRRAEELARLAPEDPEFVPPLGPQQYLDTPTYAEATAAITPEYRARVAAASIEPARAQELAAAGFLQDGASAQALMNSAGLFAYNRSTGADFSLTVRTPDGTGSGYVERDFNDVGTFDAAAVSAVAIDKAMRSREPRAIEPGKYTVILEPSASVGLLGNMMGNFSARSADEGRSFLTKPGGGNKRGERIVDERINIYSDPTDPRVPTSPWTGDGQARRRTTWLRDGVVENLYYDRYWAEQQGVEAVPFPGNIIMEGGDASIEDMIRDTRRGVLVTRLWYIRTVDPQTLLYTGLTRDGTFYIENGQIRYPVKNFRFNESPVIMLNNVEALGAPMRMNGDLIPPMKIRDFTFTSLSDAI